MDTLNRPLPHRAERLAGAFVLLSALAFVGCGGGNGSGATTAPRGQVKITVTWPTSASRVIPLSAQSLVVQVKQGATVVNSGLIVRPANSITLSEVPTGSLSVTATAYPNADGSGNALASATISATVTDGSTSNVNVTMASTIDHLQVTPNPFILGATLNATINVVALDASGNVVLLAPSDLSFSSSNASVVSVTSAGLVTAGSSDGSATISILESDGGKSLSLPLNVVPTVAFTGGSTNLTLRGTTTFTASVVGPSNTAVNWSVQEGASGGTITSGGLYTAPATHGTYHVVATSAADATRTATATLTVTSGGLGVTVN